jgi:hypothetical protein
MVRKMSVFFLFLTYFPGDYSAPDQHVLRVGNVGRWPESEYEAGI